MGISLIYNPIGPVKVSNHCIILRDFSIKPLFPQMLWGLGHKILCPYGTVYKDKYKITIKEISGIS